MTDYVGANFDVGEALGPEAVIETCKAGAALSKGVFVALAAGTDKTVNTAGADADVYGVAMKAASAAGDYIPVLVFGRTKMQCGGTVTAGNAVASDANGKPVDVADQAVDEGGTAKYTIYYNHVAGIAVQSGVLNDYVIIFVGRR